MGWPDAYDQEESAVVYVADGRSREALDGFWQYISIRGTSDIYPITLEPIDWETPIDLRTEDDPERPSWEAQVDREALFETVACATEEAVLNSPDKRAERRAIRAAVLDTLEAFAVITRTRGGRT